ncbi:MAG: glycoside hydrolase family 88 protein [Lentisphaeria bacterium]|nr:glycoside hydrolase family 88 protein [Lentisphaeria bacterium]
MKDTTGYLGRCLSLYNRKIGTAGNDAFILAGPLLEFSAVRLAKVGTMYDHETHWETLRDELVSRIKTVPEEMRGETTGLEWPLHPGAAWLAARQIGDYSAGVTEAAEKLVAEGHRNADGLFDDPVYPGHLSTEIMAMTIPGLAFAGKCSGNNQFYEEAIRQYEGYAAVLYDPAARLWHPGFLPGKAGGAMWRAWDKSQLTQKLYLKDTGVFSGCWGRGEGYALFALSELVFEWPDGHEKKAELLQVREQMLSGLLQYQDPNGMWHQVLNDWGSYPETSGTAWILYAMGRVIKRCRESRAAFLEPYQRGLAGMGRYLGWNGSLFNASSGCICPGGRGTAADYALLGWHQDEPAGYAPVLLALQQAAQIERHTELIPSYQQVMEQYPGDEE